MLKQTVTPERLRKVVQSYKRMYALAIMLDMEYSQYMDTNFKDQTTHNHIKRIGESIKAVINRHKDKVDLSDELDSLEAVLSLLEINQMFLTMSAKRIQAFAENMKREIENESKATSVS